MISVVDRTRVAKPPVGALRLMAAAVNQQVRVDFCPAWGRTSWHVSEQPGGAIIAAIVDDDPNAPGALAYHDDPGGKPDIVVLAKTILDNGGDWLTRPLSVASALSHEVLELIADPSCNFSADDGNGQTYALEVCDPVESHSYAVVVQSTAVTVSDFVLPRWFDPSAAGGRFDHLGQVRAPFALSSGYAIVTPEGQSSQITGEVAPWHNVNHAFSRTRRRLA